MNEVLVTGANGFVGQHLCKDLSDFGIKVIGAVRKNGAIADNCDVASIGDIDRYTNWATPLEGITTVIHAAARVHVMREKEANPLDSFREVNLHGTVELARQSAKKGVRRFIYLSSVKVNGERTPGRPFSADDIPSPEGPYAQSKWEAEQALWEQAEEAGMDVIVIRPPLIYGSAVKGNLQRLLMLIDRGVPLPLGGIHNRRSFLNVHNLTHFILTCLERPQAWGQTYMLSDGRDLSTPELVKLMAVALGQRPRLFSVPTGLLRLIGAVMGQQETIDRLCGNLQIDIEKNRDLLGWSPQSSVEEGLVEMVGHLES